jgi:hypothetical protein
LLKEKNDYQVIQNNTSPEVKNSSKEQASNEKKSVNMPKGSPAAEGAAARREIGELTPGPKDLDKNGNPLTAQNLKMRECAKRGKGRNKDDYSAFMSECLKKE